MSSAIGNLFGKKATAVQTSKTGFETLPDFGADLLKDIISQGQAFTSGNTGFSPMEAEALRALSSGSPATTQVAPAGGFQFGQRASGAFNDAGNAFNAASAMLPDALSFLRQGGSQITSDEISSGISDFMNPFEDQVVSNTLRDLQTFGQGAFGDARSLISDAGVTGSNRERLLAGDIADKLTMRAGDISSNLRSSGFQSAASNALSRLSGDRGRALQAGSGITSAAGTQAGIGSGMADMASRLFSSRLGMDTLRGTARDRDIQDLELQLRGGQGMRQGTNTENMQLLSELFKLIPVGGGGGQLRENPGFLGRLGSIAADFGRAASGFGLGV